MAPLKTGFPRLLLLLWLLSLFTAAQSGRCAPCDPPVITKQPANLTVAGCCPTACFMVSATNANAACPFGISYQWLRDGGPIPGATNDMLCLSNIKLADDGAQFSVIVSLDRESVRSDTAVLTVSPDVTPPALVSASVDCLSNKFTLVFSECLDPMRAGDPATYAINGGTVAILAVSISSDARTVCLFTGPLDSQASFTISVSQIMDQCGNVSDLLATTARCPCLGVANERITCATNSPGKLNYSFDLHNNSGVAVKYLFLVPETDCFTFTPAIVTFQPPIPPGQTGGVSAMIGAPGSDCPTNLCFLVAAHDPNLAQCCSIRHCIALPACPECVPDSRLSVVLENGTVVISWTGTGHVQCATNVTGPWSDLPAATSPYTTSAAEPHKFYRLKCP